MSSIRFQSSLNWTSALLLLLTVFLVSPQLINSDSASVILGAEALLRAGSMLSNQWIYVSDGLGIDGRAQVAMLGTALFGVSIRAYVFTVAVGALACIVSAYALGRTLGASRASAASAGLVITLGSSLIYQDIILGLMLSIQVAMAMACITCLARHVFQHGSHGYLLAAVAILMLASASSPMKAAAYVALPAIVALASMLVLNAWAPTLDRLAVRRAMLAIALLLLAMAVGYWVHLVLSKGLFVGRSYAAIDITLSVEKLKANIQLLFSLVERFSGKNNSLLSPASIWITLAGLVAITLLPGLVLRRNREPLGARWFVYLYAGIGFAAILGYLLAYESIKRYYGIYYLIIPMSSMICVAAATVSKSVGITRTSLQTALLGLLVMGSLNAAYFLMAFPDDYLGIGIHQKNPHSERAALAEWLLDHDIHFGYAHYWDANALTLISNSRVRTLPILLYPDSEKIRLHGWLVSSEWMDYATGYEGPWFIAWPVKRTKSAPVPEDCLPADRQVMHAGYVIYLYDEPRQRCFSR